MAEATLAQIFPGATQDSTEIVIPKSALDMTPLAENRADTIVAAILKRFATVLTQESRDADLDRSVVVQEGRSSLVQTFSSTGASTDWMVRSYEASLYKPADIAPVNADDY